jgi:hypothetical protein
MTDPKVFGDMENATNTDPAETADVDENPSDTVSGGSPEPAGDDDE